MNNYLLLRDNKQSGPYSVKELAAHGLKPYDLVWLEGRSAAWRYPSEIEELKAFAPVVEEQPFDRFYKKPEKVTIEPAVQDNTRVRSGSAYSIKDTPLEKEKLAAEQKVVQTKKIHVSLPGSKSEQQIVSKKYTEEPQPVSDRIKQADTLKSEPLRTDMPVAVASSYKTKTADVKEENVDETYKTSKYRESASLPSVATPAPVSKLLFRTVTAACLLLGGAFIGLVINYNSQQKKFQQLNQMVQEIKQQENTSTTMPAKPEIVFNNSQVASEPVDSAKTEQPVYKEDIQIPVTKKINEQRKGAGSAIPQTPPPVNTNTEPVAEPAPDPAVEPVKTDRASTELARKNLWQLVSVQNNSYKTGVLGGISKLELKLSNKSLYQLEQVEVEIKYLNAEKKVVNRQVVFFENVSPGEQLALEVPKSPRGVKIDYAIKKISTKELGLAHAGM